MASEGAWLEIEFDVMMGIGMGTRTVKVELRLEFADEIQLATAMVNTCKILEV